jgi:16S rRNA (guanine966-N2)-methyltransferase
MRVIAGTSRGRPLRAPRGGTRPTSDRVREAVFDILASQFELEGAAVLDLFAGSGAMGIEALSRGAGSVVFVERDRRAAQCIGENLEGTGLGDRDARVVVGDAVSYVARATPVDLALCDPPYVFDAWPQLLADLPASVAVLETARPPELPERWESVRCRRYGGTLVTVVRAKRPAHRQVPDRDEAVGRTRSVASKPVEDDRT